MPAELVIRPGHNDHLVIANLIAPGSPGRQAGAPPPVSRLVLDAALAAQFPQYAEEAATAGLPVTVDPTTFLLQGRTDPDNAWSKLPFASADALAPTLDLRALVEQAVTFQIEQNATTIVPPYFQAASPDDPWFAASLQAIDLTATFLQETGRRLPLIPVLSARLDVFGREKHWQTGLDLFADTARGAGSQLVVAQLGPAGKPNDGYAKVLKLFLAIERLRRPGLAVHVWRQGVYGSALVAAGFAQGYEVGINYGESTDIAAYASRRRPKIAPPPSEDGEEKERDGSRTFAYLQAFGRLRPTSHLTLFSDNLALRAATLCDDATLCCPDGISTTLGPTRRHHTIRARAREISAFEAMPAQPAWRLHKVEQDARKRSELIKLTNRALEADKQQPLSPIGQDSLADVAHYLRAAKSAAA